MTDDTALPTNVRFYDFQEKVRELETRRLATANQSLERQFGRWTAWEIIQFLPIDTASDSTRLKLLQLEMLAIIWYLYSPNPTGTHLRRWQLELTASLWSEAQFAYYLILFYLILGVPLHALIWLFTIVIPFICIQTYEYLSRYNQWLFFRIIFVFWIVQALLFTACSLLLLNWVGMILEWVEFGQGLRGIRANEYGYRGFRFRFRVD